MVRDMSRRSLFIFNFKEKKGAVCVIAKFIVFWTVILVFFFSVVSPEYLYGYNASLIDKVARLESIHGPKIVLIGNSNLAFGIRSQLIEDAFEMPVVNMGLHGGLGNAFHENMARLNVCEGDIVILCHSAFADGEANPDLTWITVESHWKLWKIIGMENIPVMLKAFPTYMKKSLDLFLTGTGNLTVDSSYSRNAFNKYGDNVYSRTHEEYFSFEEGYVPNPPGISDSCIERINRLNDSITEAGGILLIAGYPVAYVDAYPDAGAFREFSRELGEKADCPVISEYEDYFFEAKYFYNANLHLTEEGAVKRTNQLIWDLRRYLSGEGESD